MTQGQGAGRLRGVLHVVHGHGGGTEHHVRALVDASRQRYRHHLAVALGDAWQLETHGPEGRVRTVELVRRPDQSWPDFVGEIRRAFGIDLVHLHNISGCRDGIFAALGALDLPYGYTVHDLGFACPTLLFLDPQGNYCFEQTDPKVCGDCLRAQPPFAGVDIVDWRERHRGLVARAAFLIAPSRWAASALTRYFPGLAIEVIPHGPPGTDAREAAADAARGAPRGPELALQLPEDGLPTVAVLGAVGPDKGARRLERLADLVRAGRQPLRFVLIGYMDVRHGPWQSDDAVLTVHGRYDARDLPELLGRYRVRLVAFPSAGPESFSFTLSETWAAGLPAIVPPFGALGERLEGTGAGWLWTREEWRDEAKMLARIVDVLDPGNSDTLRAAGERARALPRPSVAEMAERTLRLYDVVPSAWDATTGGAADRAPFPETPTSTQPRATAPDVAASGTVHSGGRLRRAFERFAPGRFRDAVKARRR